MQWSEPWAQLWGGPTPVTLTHADDAVARLMEQYREQSVMVKTIRVIADRYQALENFMQYLRVMRILDHAQGVQLDVVGEWVNLARPSTDDEVYRFLLRMQIRVVLPNTSTIPGIISIALAINEEDPAGIELIEYYPAFFYVKIPRQNDSLQEFYRQILENAGALGVGAHYVLYDPTIGILADSTVSPLADPHVAESVVSPLADAGLAASVIG